MIGKLFNQSIMKSLFSTRKLEAVGKYSQKYSKARTAVSLYNLDHIIMGNVFVAPNATIAGEVFLGNQISVWHGTVIRGDINSVMIYHNVCIGNNCVIHTAASTSSGLPAHVEIQSNCVVQHGCTLYSCILKQNAYIGYNSVVLQGAIIQQGAIIAPNSVVPPGRVVPAMQVWGGNPIKFIRHVKQQQAWITSQVAREHFRNSNDYRQQFLPYNNAYLYKESTPEDLEFQEIRGVEFIQKHAQTLKYDPLNATIN